MRSLVVHLTGLHSGVRPWLGHGGQVLPSVHPLDNSALNNVYVVPTRMWGAPPSLSQYWKVILPPEQ